MFKEKFKYYKRKDPEPSLENVINVKTGDPLVLKKFETKCKGPFYDKEAAELGLKDVFQWKIYELNEHSGLIFIVNPFTNLGQRYWIARSIADYPNKPSITNLCNQNNLSVPLNNKTWWQIARETSDNKFTKKLRWATMGYHHNWDTKVYSEESKDPFPCDLARLSRFIVKSVLNMNFEPEASIVNYYLMDSFLSGHVDRSEMNTSAPLISFSFGQTAIFLVGGHTLEENPDALFLESGDILLMIENGRYRYHGVPKIIHTPYECWNHFEYENNSFIKSMDCDKPWDNASISASNRITFSNYGDEDRVTMEKVADAEFWKPFANYLKNARVNLNVRQVFFSEPVVERHSS